MRNKKLKQKLVRMRNDIILLAVILPKRLTANRRGPSVKMKDKIILSVEYLLNEVNVSGYNT